MELKYGTWTVSSYEPADARALCAAGFSPITAALLCSRGYRDADAAREFLSCSYPLSSPFDLLDMDKAAARVRLALQRREHIAVFGDYDVDGITATCLLTEYLRSRGGHVTSYIPARLEEGYGLTEAAIDNAIAQYGEGQAVSFPDTAYSLPCYYAVTGSKVGTLGELKQALGVVKTLMTRNPRLNDAFMSGVATALCAEFIEVLKYLNGAAPYELPCYGHLSDAVIRNLGVPLVTGDIPGVAVILGSAPSADEAVALVKSYQSQGILITLVGGVIDQLEEKGYKFESAQIEMVPQTYQKLEKPEPPKAAPAPAAPAVPADGLTAEVRIAILAALQQEPGFDLARVSSIDIRRI